MLIAKMGLTKWMSESASDAQALEALSDKHWKSSKHNLCCARSHGVMVSILYIESRDPEPEIKSPLDLVLLLLAQCATHTLWCISTDYTVFFSK